MIEHGPYPGVGAMTGVTRQGGGDMGGPFAGGCDVVVAVGTLIRGLAVVNGLQRGGPHIGAVATIAEVAGDGMGGGFIGPSTDAIVATGLSTGLAGDQSVIEGDAQPTRRGMAGVTRQGGGNMGRPFAGGCDVVVAVGTLIRGLAVVDGLQRGGPDVGGMTTVAEVAGDGVCGGLKGTTTDAVVATALGAGLPRH